MASSSGHTLWMGDLEPYMDEFFVMQAFDQMGEPASLVKLIKNRLTGLPAGYCFVEFPDGETAQRAMLRLNGKIIPNSQPPRRFKLNNAGFGKEHVKPEFSLFVGELSDEVDDYMLFTVFSKRYTSCHAAKVVLDNHGRSKGYGFVRFAEETEQQKALIEMQHMTGIGRRPIRVSLATPKRQQTETSGGHGQYHGGGGYYGGSYNYNYPDYHSYYQQYYNQYTAQQQPYYHPMEDPDILEEPELEVNVHQYNMDFMEQSEEIFDAMEKSRWHDIESLNNSLMQVKPMPVR